MKEKLEASWVRVLFTYGNDGFLRWNVPAGRHGRIERGTVAGSIHTDQDGYQSRYVTIQGRQYKASHLIWAWMTGEWPKRTIDHKNLDSLDDRWDNLREAGLSEQKQNNRKRKDNRTGFKCVVYDGSRDKYRWQVVVNGKRIKSGQRFDTAEAAYHDYCLRLPQWHGDFANNGVAP